MVRNIPVVSLLLLLCFGVGSLCLIVAYNQNRKKRRKKGTKFTYSGKETRFITKILKKAGLHIAFTTRQTIGNLLKYKTHQPSDKYEESGVYQLTSLDCHKHYIGQTASSYRTRFGENAQDYRHGNHRSNFAKHLLECKHALHPMEDSMSILHISNKGRMLNTMERFRIYKQTGNQNQINDRYTVTRNAIFDAVLYNPTSTT
jgi:hypothetical protein